MFKSTRKIVVGLVALLGVLALLGQFQVSLAAALNPVAVPETGSHPGVPDALAGIQYTILPPQRSLGARPVAPEACPGNTGGLPDTIERTNFCVYYDDNNGNPVNPGDPPAVTTAQATQAADWIEDYWDAYVGFGFSAPAYTGKLEIQLIRSAGCNGGTSPSSNVYDAYSGCFAVTNDIRVVLGHELFHRVQYSYDGYESKWFKEGAARAIQDNVFADIDSWAGALGSAFSFNTEANNYLANTNRDITSYEMRYMAALWWKYFSEQYGSVTTEPQLGVDAFVALWQAAIAADDIAALNNALAGLGAGTNFDTAFRRFAVANITKDLTGVPDGSYDYIDENLVGNPAPYGPIEPTDGGTINAATPASFTNQAIVRYGATYYEVAPAATCQVITVAFHRDSGAAAFYHVVTQKGTAFARVVEGSGADWTQSFLNDGITRVVAIAGSTSSASQVDISFSCATPVLDVKLPNSGAVAHVGPNTGPGKFLAQVLVTNGSPTSPVVAGLTNSDFKARVNSLNAVVSGGGFIQEQYWLVIQAPTQAANGTYDLEVTLEAPGTSTAIASDTNTGSVAYDSDASDQVLVFDRSGSMGVDSNYKLIAAQDAAKLYVDISRTGDGLSVVPFNHNVDPAPFAMQASNATVRANARTYIGGLTASGATSIGDGLQEAVNQRLGSPTGSPRCSFVLLSDGMENSAAFYATVKTAVQNIHCPVTSIAFGPESSEVLMQTIATDTGGIFFYNDVYVSARPSPDGSAAPAAPEALNMNLELSNTYEYAQGRAERRQRLLQENGELVQTQQKHVVHVDDSTAEMVFILDWPGAGRPSLELQKPDGTLLTKPDFANYSSGYYMGYRVLNPDPGDWTMLVDWGYVRDESALAPQQGLPYQVMASGKSNQAVLLITPDRFGRRFFTGNRMPIYAVVTANRPIPGLVIFAGIIAPDGTLTRLRLFDDGQHDDGVAGDNFYGNWYTRVNQSRVVPPTGEDITQPTPLDEGGYRVTLDAAGTGFQRETLGSFAVQAGPDANGNNLPDTWETETGQTNPNADPDLDQLVNLDEYLSGTNPLLSDTDNGGENDGSEVDDGEDPLNPNDDQIEAPEFLTTAAGNSLVQLEYDVKPAYTEMLLYRATSLAGPWGVRVPELPASGVYSDAATNGTTYFYKLEAVNAGGHRSAIINAGDATTPSTDPIPPQARVLINGGAANTGTPRVGLSFVPYDSEDFTPQQTFDDITQMKISNSPLLTGASWQTFAQDVPWTLDVLQVGQTARVYVQFRDAAGNESTIEVGMILLTGTGSIYLPVMTNHPIGLSLIPQP